MKIGVHPYLWDTSFNNETLGILDRIKNIGFDAVEIPLRLMDNLSSELLRKRLKDLELDAVCSATIKMETDITSPDSAVRKKGKAYLERCVDFTARIEAGLLTGVVYSPFRKNLIQPPEVSEWKYAVDGVREICAFAVKKNICLGIEPLNRYETYLINTARQGLDFIGQVGADNLKLHLDTYHMNIEEKNLYEAIVSAGDRLGYLHVSENDRGFLGEGHFNWNEAARALKEIKYNGIGTIETFVCDDSPVSFATCTWRKLFQNSDKMAEQGLKFLKLLFKDF